MSLTFQTVIIYICQSPDHLRYYVPSLSSKASSYSVTLFRKELLELLAEPVVVELQEAKRHVSLNVTNSFGGPISEELPYGTSPGPIRQSTSAQH